MILVPITTLIWDQEVRFSFLRLPAVSLRVVSFILPRDQHCQHRNKCLSVSPSALAVTTLKRRDIIFLGDSFKLVICMGLDVLCLSIFKWHYIVLFFTSSWFVLPFLFYLSCFFLYNISYCFLFFPSYFLFNIFFLLH